MILSHDAKPNCKPLHLKLYQFSNKVSTVWLNTKSSNKTKLNKSPWYLWSASQWPNPQTQSGERGTGRAWRSGRTSAREDPRGRDDHSPPDHSASAVHGHVRDPRELKEEPSPHFCGPLCSSEPFFLRSRLWRSHMPWWTLQAGSPPGRWGELVLEAWKWLIWTNSE